MKRSILLLLHLGKSLADSRWYGIKTETQASKSIWEKGKQEKYTAKEKVSVSGMSGKSLTLKEPETRCWANIHSIIHSKINNTGKRRRRE